jgi:hypothetical protein
VLAVRVIVRRAPKVPASLALLPTEYPAVSVPAKVAIVPE